MTSEICNMKSTKKKNTSSFGVCVVDNNKRETQMRERAYPMED